MHGLAGGRRVAKVGAFAGREARPQLHDGHPADQKGE